MRFWDASALTPLVVAEATTPIVSRWLRDDSAVAIWALTRVELASAIERRVREGTVDVSQRVAALERAARIVEVAHEVADLGSVRTRAIRARGCSSCWTSVSPTPRRARASRSSPGRDARSSLTFLRTAATPPSDPSATSGRRQGGTVLGRGPSSARG